MNMTTELAQRMKAAALNAKHAGEAPIMHFDERISALKEFQLTACPANVVDLVEALEARDKRNAEQSAIIAAAEKLVRCKGRYHSELNYRELAKLFGVTTPDLPPLEHENVHYADAAEIEIAALRQRIAELEAKLATPVLLPKTNGYWTEQEKAFEEGITLAKRQVRLAGFRIEENE